MSIIKMMMIEGPSWKLGMEARILGNDVANHRQLLFEHDEGENYITRPMNAGETPKARIPPPLKNEKGDTIMTERHDS